MRGVSEDAIQTTFFIFIAMISIFALFTFASSIFQKSARLSITEFDGGGCVCKDADSNVQVRCGEGQKFACNNRCDQAGSPLGGLPKTCYGKQILDMTNALNYKVQRIEICTIVKFSVGNILNAESRININGKEYDKITGPRDKENCNTYKFSTPLLIKKIEADAGVGAYMDRLIARWNAPAPLEG